MGPRPLVYTSDDRSILLPYYRRRLVEPLLGFLPPTLSPNTITHVGHLVHLVGVALLLTLQPKSGWPYLVATLCLTLYVWCDNADGAHARRTGQCSPLGEFLDHGLDQLNTVYIALLTAMALDPSPLWWVAIAILIPGAAVVAYWEQSNTGVFRLGLLNQVESSIVLSSALLTTAALGQDFWDRELAPGVPLSLPLLVWTAVTILFGMARGIVIVARRASPFATLPIMAFLGLHGAVFLAAHAHAITPMAAVAIATAANVSLGTRMLAQRLREEAPRTEAAVVGWLFTVSGALAWQLVTRPSEPPSASLSMALAVMACLHFGLQSLADARSGLSLVRAHAVK